MKTAYTGFVRKEYKPKIQSWIDDWKNRHDKDFFQPCGLQSYVGRQGSGKTISAVAHHLKVKKRYPKAILVTNLELSNVNLKRVESEYTDDKQRERHLKTKLQMVLRNFDTTKDAIYFQTADELAAVLVGVNNGKYGVYYIIDEIQNYFNSTESKNMPLWVFTEISQQRKQRKLIVCTSQLFTRMAKPFREQCDNMIMCKTFFGVFTLQFVYDGMSLPDDFDNKINPLKALKFGWFWHTREIRKSYDTFQKVVSAQQMYENSISVSIADATKKRPHFGRA